MELTSQNQRMVLSVAVSYGGRWDIVQASKALASQVASEQLSVNDIDERQFAQQLALGDLPEPDLCIRTGGEQRISNFLLWQLAYAELYFSDLLWPDFDEKALDYALIEYASRQRRFGKTSEQVAGK